MGNLIDRSASASRLVEDVREALACGRTKPEPVRGVVVHAFARFVEAADKFAAEVARRTEAVRKLRAVVAHANLESNDRIRRLHDEAYNDIGRSRSDPVFRLVYPRGGGTYALKPAASKATALEDNAALLETANHPRLSAAWVASASAQLRAQAAVVRAAVEALAPAVEALQMAEKAYRANARAARVALGRLKHTLVGMGLTEHEIHEIIPSRPRKPKAKAAPPESVETPREAAEGAAADGGAAEGEARAEATEDASGGTRAEAAGGASRDGRAEAAEDAAGEPDGDRGDEDPGDGDASAARDPTGR